MRRHSDSDPDEKLYESWHRDPENWRYGIFYYNPKDQRVIVWKRIKLMGLTLNFAHAVSHVIMGLLILLFFLFVFAGLR
jgi:uncharacterized membrane protein